jgi:hypothetical protein
MRRMSKRVGIIGRESGACSLGMMARIGNVLMDNVANLQRSELREDRRITRDMEGTAGPNLADLKDRYNLQRLAYFRTSSLPAPHWPRAMDRKANRELIARLRTDLDCFGEVEQAALINHGYETADIYIRKYVCGYGKSCGASKAPDFSKCRGSKSNPPPFPPCGSRSCPAPFVLPIDETADPERVEKILSAGAHRAFRAIRLFRWGEPPAWLSLSFTLAIIGVSAWLASGVHWYVRSIIAWVADRAADYLDSLGLNHKFGWVDHAVNLGLLILVGVILIALYTGWKWMLNKWKLKFPRVFRPCLFFLKWARSFAANILWLLGLTPLWIALAGSMIAWISYVFYGLPFLGMTRIDKK